MKRRLTWFVCGALALLLMFAPVSAQAQETEPLPHAFYGDLTFTGGVAAPAGTTVIAKVGGVVCGQITTTVAGKYGDAPPTAPKLLVQSVAGAPINFYVTLGVDEKQATFLVDGVTTNVYTLVPEETTKLDLTSEAPAAPTPAGGVATAPPEITPEELEAMPPDEAARILEKMSPEDAAALLAQISPEAAARIIDEMEPGVAANILEEMAPADAARILEKKPPDHAALILAETQLDIAGDIMDEMSPAAAALILAEMSPADAAAILAEMSPAAAAAVLEEMSPEDAAAILEEMSPDAAAAILEEMSPKAAASVMEEMSTESLTEIIPLMSEEALLKTLPELSADKLHEIPPEVLFAALPNAPTEQLVTELPPVPPPGSPAPVVVYVTPTGARYMAIRTTAGEWVIIVGSPMPVDELMIKVAESLENVEAVVEEVTEPPEASALPTGSRVASFFTISLLNITPEQLAVGHIRFKVENTWIEENSINKWSIFLNRYDDKAGKWVKLPTTKKSEDKDYVYYDAAINAFSLFAIVGSTDVPPLDFTASNLSIKPSQVKMGEDVTITADITNELGITDKYVASLWINSTIEDTRYLTLVPGTSATISFTVAKSKAGTYQVRIGRQMGSFEVLPEAIKPAFFQVTELDISPAKVKPGEEVTISARVTNTGDTEDSYAVALKIDGTLVETKRVTLGAGMSTTVTFSVTRDAGGTYQVEVDGQIGEFEVKSPFPWWWIVIGVVVVGLLVYFFVLRRRFGWGA